MIRIDRNTTPSSVAGAYKPHENLTAMTSGYKVFLMKLRACIIDAAFLKLKLAKAF